MAALGPFSELRSGRHVAGLEVSLGWQPMSKKKGPTCRQTWLCHADRDWWPTGLLLIFRALQASHRLWDSESWLAPGHTESLFGDSTHNSDLGNAEVMCRRATPNLCRDMFSAQK